MTDRAHFSNSVQQSMNGSGSAQYSIGPQVTESRTALLTPQQLSGWRQSPTPLSFWRRGSADCWGRKRGLSQRKKVCGKKTKLLLLVDWVPAIANHNWERIKEIENLLPGMLWGLIWMPVRSDCTGKCAYHFWGRKGGTVSAGLKERHHSNSYLCLKTWTEPEHMSGDPEGNTWVW